MKAICGGMEYRYDDETGELFNNYGTKVAETDLDDTKRVFYVMVEPEYDHDMAEPSFSAYIKASAHGRMVSMIVAYTRCLEALGYNTRTGLKTEDE